MSELVFGPLEGVAGDPSVTDVVVTGEGRIWVDRGGGNARIPAADSLPVGADGA